MEQLPPGIFHLTQAVLFVILAETVTIDVTAMFATGPPGQPVDGDRLEVLFSDQLARAVAAFSALSALFRFLVVSRWGWRRYRHRELLLEQNRFRWVEYAMSASLMIVLIAGISGISAVAALVSAVRRERLDDPVRLLDGDQERSRRWSRLVAFRVWLPTCNEASRSDRADSDGAIGVFSFSGFLPNTPRFTPMAGLPVDPRPPPPTGLCPRHVRVVAGGGVVFGHARGPFRRKPIAADAPRRPARPHDVEQRRSTAWTRQSGTSVAVSGRRLACGARGERDGARVIHPWRSPTRRSS